MILDERFKPFIYGSFAGAIGYIGTLPLDYIKQQVQTTNNLNILNNIKKNNFKTFFKGGIIGSFSIIPQMAIKFSVNDYLSKKSHNNYFNGFIAGYIDGSFLGPILAIQSVLQHNKNYTYSSAFKMVLKNKFILPLTGPLAMRNAAYTSVMFGGRQSFGEFFESYDKITSGDFFESYDKITSGDSNNYSFLKDLAISSALNVLGVIACSPFDVIRAKQINNIVEDKTVNPFYIAKDIYRIKGIKGFYQGVHVLYINFAIRFPLTFSLYLFLMN